MSTAHLPAELLDHVVDYLHDTKHALRNCCLISKSWIPRTRAHLFATVQLYTEEDLESWKETFPDPSTSPGHYTETLLVNCLHVVTAEDAEAGGWIRGFSRVVSLEVAVDHDAVQSAHSLALFHGFSPVIKSLRVAFSIVLSTRIFDLALSFPLLEDLAVVNYYIALTDMIDGPDGILTIPCPSVPPMTGTLELLRYAGIEPIARRLLSTPGGIHFRKLVLTWYQEGDILSARELVEECSRTLESLHINCDLDSTESKLVSIDLSKATGLESVAFRLGSKFVGWVPMAIRTITPKHRDLRRISIYTRHCSTLVSAGIDVGAFIGEVACQQWLDLDHLLVQLWESHSIRPRVISVAVIGETPDMRECFALLMPEVTRRGIIDLVK